VLTAGIWPARRSAAGAAAAPATCLGATGK